MALERDGPTTPATRWPPGRHLRRDTLMKIVVIGGTGLIGSKLTTRLREHGHEAVPASPDTGVNTLTGDGLAEVLVGADVVVDVSNSPTLDGAAIDFFRTATGNLLAAEETAGVGHHVALSVVGTDRFQQSPYFQGKQIQEDVIAAGPIPFSIVHATQFFEFVKTLADGATDGDTVLLSSILIQPMAADDVASSVGRVAVGTPIGGVVEVGGPQPFRLDELARQALEARHDPRQVVTDPRSRYWGMDVDERALLPGPDARLSTIRFDDWLAQVPS